MMNLFQKIMIEQFRLSNKNGFSVIIITYGGIIKEINIPDRNGKIENIVLNYKKNEEYLEDKFFIGALIGRYANRIENGAFSLKNEKFQLDKNEGDNHLHGGNEGFNKKFWKVVDYDSVNEKFIKLSYCSKHLECGYPGNLKCDVKYSINDKDEFTIEFMAISDKDTIFNPTSHSYFNLNPSKTSILDHKLKINAIKYIPTNKKSLPKNDVKSVIDTAFNFNKSKKIKVDINNNDDQILTSKGYDHCFILDNNKTNIAAELSENITGRKLIIKTDQPGVQLYTGNHLKGKFKKNQGLCLETQNFPNSPNIKSFPSSVLKANRNYYSKTSYHFSLK